MFLLRGASPSSSLIPSEFLLQMSNQIQEQPLPGFVTRNDKCPPQMRMWLYVIATLLVLGFGVEVLGTTDLGVGGEGKLTTTTIHSVSQEFSGICFHLQSL